MIVRPTLYVCRRNPMKLQVYDVKALLTGAALIGVGAVLLLMGAEPEAASRFLAWVVPLMPYVLVGVCILLGLTLVVGAFLKPDDGQ
jgi:hypothetical protein